MMYTLSAELCQDGVDSGTLLLGRQGVPLPCDLGQSCHFPEPHFSTAPAMQQMLTLHVVVVVLLYVLCPWGQAEELPLHPQMSMSQSLEPLGSTFHGRGDFAV